MLYIRAWDCCLLFVPWVFGDTSMTDKALNSFHASSFYCNLIKAMSNGGKQGDKLINMVDTMDLWNKALKSAMVIPVVKVDRETFIRKELAVYCNPEQLNVAISDSPLKVLNKTQISKIANGCIKYHLTLVCSTSALAGLPGGWGMIGTIPADIAQFYAHVFALIQKLLYLYGWPDLQNEQGELDDETAQILTLFTGVMIGSQAAVETVQRLGMEFAKQVVIRLPKKALTKYAVYNVAKQVAKWIGIKLTKDGFAKSISKIIPLIGAPISAGVTYWTFKPMANRLKRHLDEQLNLLI